MEIEVLSTSSIGNFDHCPHKFFIGSVLGYREPSGKAALLGTIFHKCAELRAKSVINPIVKDSIFGDLDYDNTSIEDILDKVFSYYKDKNPELNLVEKDKKESLELFNRAINYSKCSFDPKKMNVIEVEKFFELPVDKEWGSLKLRGVIDLITQIDDRTIHIFDWKTGNPNSDFLTGKEKNEETLYRDPQIRLYNYAAFRLFDVDTVLFTIYFVKYDKPFTIVIDKSEMWKVEKFLQIKYKKITNTTDAVLNKSWKCKMCGYSKMKWGDGQTYCDFFNEKVLIDGMEQTVTNYKKEKINNVITNKI